MQFSVLGPLEVSENGENYAVGGPKQRAVLALLIANAGRPVSTGSLIEGVYGDHPPQGARRSIQTYVSNLRGELGDVIHGTSDGYELEAEPGQIDAVRFEDIVSSAPTDEPSTASSKLTSALALWRGHPYADIDGGETIDFEARRLGEMRMHALETRIEAGLAIGQHRTLIPELESLTSEYPLRERFTEQLMLALYRSGRQGEALRSFERTRSYLIDQMGLDPSPELRALEQRILEHDPSLNVDTSTSIRRAAVMVCDVANPQLLSSMSVGDRTSLLDAQSEAIEEAAATHGGRSFAASGSASFLTFPRASEAAMAAAEMQRRLDGIESPGHRLRLGIDIGEVEVGDSVTGPPVNRAAAIVSAAHGGQVLLSAAAHHDITDTTGGGWVIRSLGSHDLQGLENPEAVHQLVIDGLPDRFPPLRSAESPTMAPVSPNGVAGYEVREEVGAGVFGIVHRGYQPSVGREVAIKVISPEWANRPDFVRRFEVEAQLIARLEHPHIVPLYDYWREPDRAFLVMRWIRGGNLQSRIDVGPIDLEETTAIVEQIASALAAAHRNGVVHRDLKPANVLLDREGYAYLTDFGIAKDMTLTQLSNTGAAPTTPAYVVPEELTGGPITPQTDIYALGMLVRDCLGTTATDEVTAVLDRATQAEPELRYRTATDFRDAWIEAVGRPGTVTQAPASFTDTRNPYKGLAAFTELDAADFHGRSELIDQLISALGRNELVAAVGPSGIGKSSVVKAGLLPALRGGALPSSADWYSTSMVPGAYPFDEMAAAIMRVAVRAPSDLEELLRKDERGLGRAVGRYLPEGATLVFALDQFEELFTMCDDETERQLFLDTIVATIADPQARVKFVCTIRADFFDRPLSHAEFGSLLQSATVPITAPSRTELLEMIRLPAEGVGVTFEPGLADRIADEVLDQPGGLPLLEFALTDLFAARDADVITNASYDASAGVMAALGRRAESTFDGLARDQQDACRDVFLRCVAVNPDGIDTRRRVRLSELRRLPHELSAIEGALDAFLSTRLLTTDIDIATRAPSVELAHEAIIQRWERLRLWLDGFRVDLLAERRVLMSASEWEASGEDQAFLLTGSRLSRAEALAESSSVALTSSEREFIARSRDTASSGEATRRRNRRAIMAVLGATTIAASIFAITAISANTTAQRQKTAAEEARAEAQIQADRADDEATIARDREQQSLQSAAVADANAESARAQRIMANSSALLDEDPDLALLLAVAAIDVWDAAVDGLANVQNAAEDAPLPASLVEHDPSALATLRKAKALARTERVIAFGDDRVNVRGDMHPDAGLIAVGAEASNEVRLFNVATGKLMRTVVLPGEALDVRTDAKFVRGGQALVVVRAYLDDALPPIGEAPRPDLLLVDHETGTTIAEFDIGTCGGVIAVNDLSTDHVLIERPTAASVETRGCATAEGEFEFVRVHLDSGTETAVHRPYRPSLDVVDVSLDETGTLMGLSDVGPGTLERQIHEVVNIETGETVFRPEPVFGHLVLPSPNARRVHISSDGSQAGRFAHTYDVPGAGPPTRTPSHSGIATAGRWTPSGDRVVTVAKNGSVQLIEGADGTVIQTIVTGSGGKTDLGMSRTGETIAVFGSSGAVSIVALGPDRTSDIGVIDTCPDSPVGDPLYLSGGLELVDDSLLVNSYCSPPFLDDGPAVASIEDFSFERYPEISSQGIALTPDAGGLSGAATATNYDFGLGHLVLLDRSQRVTTQFEGTCEYDWIALNGEGCVEPPDTPSPFNPLDLDYSPDGSLIAGSPWSFGSPWGDGYVRVWEAETQKLLATFPGGPSEFSSDGRRLVTIEQGLPNDTHAIVVRETETWNVLTSRDLIGSDRDIESPAFALDDTLVIAGQFGDSAGDVIYFDSESLEIVRRIQSPHGGAVRDIVISNDDATMATAGNDGSVRLWDIREARQVDAMNLGVGRTAVAVAFNHSDDWIIATSNVGPVLIYSRNATSVVQSARDRLFRGFTQTECERYFGARACPTLEEMQTG